MIALVDYGAGNLTSVRKALNAIGASTWTPAVAGELGRAHGIIVPGVGHFDSTKALTGDWRTAIKTIYGRSNHHKIEACFKAFGRALRVACSKDKRLAKMLPSTKGLL